MNNQQDSIELQEKVEEIVYKLLQNKNFVDNASLKQNKANETITEGDVDIINQLF